MALLFSAHQQLATRRGALPPLRLLALLAGVLWVPAPDAGAHIITEGGIQRPIVELRIAIGDAAVVEDVHVPLKVYLREVHGLDVAGATGDVHPVAAFRALEEAEKKRAAESFFFDRCPLSIDGVAVRPVLESYELQEPRPAAATSVEDGEATPASGGAAAGSPDASGETTGGSAPSGTSTGPGEPPGGGAPEAAPTLPSDPDAAALEYGAVQLRLRAETKGAPRRVSMIWRLYDPDGPAFLSYGAEAVVAEIEAGGRKTLEVFTASEPEVIWHSPDAARPPPDLAVPDERPRATLAVPVGAVALAIAALLLAALPRSAPPRARLVRAALAAALAAASLPLDATWASIDLPWERRLARPGDDEAIAVFETLHRNIYRAFDHDTEGAIYDTLAQSVDGPQLEAIYADIYGSLIMREDGGAVCRIRSVDVLEARIAGEDDAVEAAEAMAGEPEGFAVYCRWRVDGLVKHWGHAHERTKEFAAVYGVAPRRGAWKIVHTGVLREERIAPLAPADAGGRGPGGT